jgi:hypothetical protein
MRRIAFALLGLLVGYPLFAFAGYWAIQLFSGNSFDRSVEASMTSIFVIGPAGAVFGIVAGIVFASWCAPIKHRGYRRRFGSYGLAGLTSMSTSSTHPCG